MCIAAAASPQRSARAACRCTACYCCCCCGCILRMMAPAASTATTTTAPATTGTSILCPHRRIEYVNEERRREHADLGLPLLHVHVGQMQAVHSRGPRVHLKHGLKGEAEQLAFAWQLPHREEDVPLDDGPHAKGRPAVGGRVRGRHGAVPGGVIDQPRGRALAGGRADLQQRREAARYIWDAGNDHLVHQHGQLARRWQRPQRPQARGGRYAHGYRARDFACLQQLVHGSSEAGDVLG